ncbi:hypothetical protein EN829_003820 [Mesorhizobium sp. M00.F.Ca.ET.186.01.1.1]|nr:hypothetical protein EN848_12405 [bacterium M00.F.Ca.ET.205.01.1.1]TGU55272.1 hypothetical protein EN795_00620 [bacterium M00.F.Ca.ET.152.01.1.1]TGV40435.1 hypothetical protein EN829_003820 [Mesorhizobium sp. M00.F.Ca.ET.186.01.1.1]TGZ45434.1 hypothetical protein EN805_03800 [bacterium M00.F.Ca.ET.162.01.1.1]TIW59997.1 MAG: hypothetical protein E5V48_15570 [Mesorhizobium sp.]
MEKYVIAMTYGKTPVLRSVVEFGERVIYLALPGQEFEREVPPVSVGFPNEFVFEHDERLFADLEKAARDSDQSALDSLWKSARPIRPI